MTTDVTREGGWKGASLATQYALASGVVLALAALLISSFLSRRIEENVVRNTATATAMFMESVLSPLGQELADQDTLGPGARQALQEIFLNTPLADRVVSYKIWKPGGVVAEASDPSLVGRSFPETDNLKRAWQGEIAAEFEPGGEEEEDQDERALGLPLLEIYSPIRRNYTGEIIAVAEFYEFHQQLESDLAAARRDAWMAVIAVMTGLGLILYLMVLRGSRLIARQQGRLGRQFADLQVLSRRTRLLRDQIRDAAGRAAEASELAMRRVGADLHDGPAQQLAFAALHLDGLRDRLHDPEAIAEVDAVENALTSAMAEIRAISRGLALPEILDRTPAQIVAMAAEEHRMRTGNAVTLQLDCPDMPALPAAARICLYRFVQEGLNNASRHAGAQRMAVELECRGEGLVLRVIDGGPGIDPALDASGLGLSGLRDRVESLGGTFRMGTQDGGGGALMLSFDTGEWK